MTERAAIVAELQVLTQRQADLVARLERLEAIAPSSEPANGSGGLKLLTAAEVMQITGLSRGKVYQLARAGGLGVVRCGEKSLRFSERGLSTWLERGEI
ncbi:MAG: helix-turn-helix domain-containing protein [bacterium]|nr:helix-turn-helix domain-containing protein [bacterium]